MKPRALLYPGAALVLAAVSAGSFCLGEHFKAQEERATFLDCEANSLVIGLQVAAMVRSGAVAGAMQRADMFIGADVLTLAQFMEPGQPPFTPHQMSVLHLAAQYRDLYPAAFDKANPYNISINHAFAVGAQSGAAEYQWFATKYLSPPGRQSTSGPPAAQLP